jgi:peptide/nickel transport system ATP-binding protein/oligopeptide transport system ATP-binding protein
MTVTANQTPLIQVRDLVKHFPITSGILLRRQVGAVKAVDGVSFDVMRGETLGVVGETGCGKSTTAKLLVRLLDATAGTISFEGEDITRRKGSGLKALRREMQMIFQDPYSSLNPRKTIGSIIAEPFAIHGLRKGEGERRQRVQELMDVVGLNPEHYNRYPHEFSGGQRQRIGVARAIALEPKVLIADEPVSALDVSIQAQVLNLLRRLQKELGLTLIFIAHDLSVVRHMCDRVAVMYLGKIAELAPNESLYGFPRHPYTGALLSAVPVAEPSSGQRERKLLSGDVPSPADPPSACRFHTRCPKAQPLCSEQDPPLEDKGGGTVAACHFPLTRDEARAQLPVALAGGTVLGEDS